MLNDGELIETTINLIINFLNTSLGGKLEQICYFIVFLFSLLYLFKILEDFTGIDFLK